MRKIRALIVDDEPPARQIIREYVAEFPQIEIVGEAGSGTEAIRLIDEMRPELVFLDVQMPGATGFEVLQQVSHFPKVIFTTAYDQYAIRAFEVNAVDYLLKPFPRQRFQKALQRILSEEEAAAQRGLEQLLSAVAPAGAQRLFIRVGAKIYPVPMEEIQWIEAAGDYSVLHLQERNYVCNLGIGALEKRLDPQKFLRVHRSAIVALAAVKSLQGDGEGGYIAHLQGGVRVRVSRSYAHKIRDLIL